VVPIVEPARCGNEARCRGREKRKQHEIDWRRGPTRPHRRVVVRVALVFNRVLGQIRERDGEFCAQPEC
jgi:hypothetical protein